jgi:hypothetical protein
LYWCLDLIRHNIGTKLKLNKYIFDISIPFCHHLHLSATLRWWQKGIEISKIYLLSFNLVPILWRMRSRHQYKTILKSVVWKFNILDSSLVVFRVLGRLKLNKYIFDISIPFCHHLYLSATLKQYFTEFALA